MIKKMKRILLLVICCFFMATVTLAQHQIKDYLTPKIIVNDTGHTVVAYIKPVRQVPVKSDRFYYWFAANKINTTQGGYSGKLLNGGFQDFYLNKNLREEGWFNAGLKDGKWKKWTEAGKLTDEQNWNSGRRNGIYVKYDALGRVAQKGKYRNDQLNGKQWIYAGDSVQVIFYKGGKLITPKQFMPGFIRKLFTKKTVAK